MLRPLTVNVSPTLLCVVVFRSSVTISLKLPLISHKRSSLTIFKFYTFVITSTYFYQSLT